MTSKVHVTNFSTLTHYLIPVTGLGCPWTLNTSLLSVHVRRNGIVCLCPCLIHQTDTQDSNNLHLLFFQLVIHVRDQQKCVRGMNRCLLYCNSPIFPKEQTFFHVILLSFFVLFSEGRMVFLPHNIISLSLSIFGEPVYVLFLFLGLQSTYL